MPVSIYLGFQQIPFNTSSGQRLSPQQQMLATFQNISNANNPQLSPRQPAFGQQTSQSQQQSNQQWTTQQANNVRLTLQQSNPMLNAQLAVSQSHFKKSF